MPLKKAPGQRVSIKPVRGGRSALYYFELKFDDRELSGGVLWFPNLKQAELEAKGTAEEIIRSLGIQKVTDSGSAQAHPKRACLFGLKLAASPLTGVIKLGKFRIQFSQYLRPKESRPSNGLPAPLVLGSVIHAVRTLTATRNVRLNLFISKIGSWRCCRGHQSKEDVSMRTLAIGIAAALSLAATAPVSAQGIWFGGPGFGVGIGFGPTYAYDAYPSYGYTSVGNWREPAWGWGGGYAYQSVDPFVDDSFAYAPAVSIGYGYEPVYRHGYRSTRYSYPQRVTYGRTYTYSPGYRSTTARYSYPERVTRRSYAYSPRLGTNRVVYASDRRAVRQHVAVAPELVRTQSASVRESELTSVVPELWLGGRGSKLDAHTESETCVNWAVVSSYLGKTGSDA